MVKERRFSTSKAPIIRKADSNFFTKDIMIHFMIALIPIVVFGFAKNGVLPYIYTIGERTFADFMAMLKPLILVIIGGLTSFLAELIYFALVKKSKSPVSDALGSYSMIPGLLIAVIVPLYTPVWVLILGCLFGTVIGKLVFGGFGKNIFNPALIGYLFIQTAFSGVIAANGGALNPMEVESIVSGATPLAAFKNDMFGSYDALVKPYGTILDFFLGDVPGAIGETSSVLCLVAFVYLAINKVIDWKIPLIYIGGVFGLTYILGAFNGHAADLWYPAYGIFTGGLMFGAVFMATEPVTAPKTPNGRVLYAISLAVLTVMFRYKSNFPEGVASSILLMNMFVFIYDNIAAPLRVEQRKWKVALVYGLFALVFLGIFAFVLFTTGKFAPAEALMINNPLFNLGFGGLK
ncbi:MAG TPA: RnfABCDGE type electron transport complex subunit D [Bacilli bacterium]|jgi:electron transport complex protein RnfD|nr:RnfABCDGE type electron transport complex subunit D [Acholeplasmataceae bacterium]HQO94058.1 RnfABCDGE type electron transport complex subunit D [Bacilli bacterium]